MTTQRKKRERFTSPQGIAKFPSLTTPDTKFDDDGVYKVDLVVPRGAAEGMIKQIDAAFAAQLAIAKKENPGKRVKEADLPYLEDAEADTVTFRFKAKAAGKRKDGTRWEQGLARFDARNKPLAPDVNIGGGSKLRIAYELNPFYVAAIGAGVSLRLGAVQVIELREYGQRSAEEYGFEAAAGEDTEDDRTDFPGREPGSDDVAEDEVDF